MLGHRLLSIILGSLLTIKVRDTLFKLRNELVTESILFLNDRVGLWHARLLLFLFEEQKVSLQLILLCLDLRKLGSKLGKFGFVRDLGQLLVVNVLDLRLAGRSYLHRLTFINITIDYDLA